jgi:hypothetical protein
MGLVGGHGRVEEVQGEATEPTCDIPPLSRDGQS